MAVNAVSIFLLVLVMLAFLCGVWVMRRALHRAGRPATGVNCPECGKPNAQAASFCGRCGRPLRS
jgi:predicted amidophosphoribosyltransferase